MLTAFERDLTEILRCALNGSVPKLSEDFDFDGAYTFAQERQITPLLYYGLCNLPGFMDTVAGKKFFMSAMNLSFFCAEQGEIIKGVSDAFKANKIHHMMVKGTVLRDLYPYPEMRLMSDADILIKEEEYPKIKLIMESLGFIEQYESDHELVWKKGEFSIELHKRLVPSYNKDYYKYFGDGWKIATIRDESTNEYFMSPEDCFVYMFVHFAKHYRDAGIGVKHLTDFYVYISKNSNLNFGYIENELSKLLIVEFWKNIKRVLDAWFENGDWDEKTAFITKRIIGSRAFGNEDNLTLARAIKASKTTKHIKLKKIVELVFPTLFSMSQKYPILKKAPILLPIMWVARWVEAIFHPSKIKEQKKNVDMISQESVSRYQSELNYVGLDFNFE